VQWLAEAAGGLDYRGTALFIPATATLGDAVAMLRASRSRQRVVIVTDASRARTDMSTSVLGDGAASDSTGLPMLGLVSVADM